MTKKAATPARDETLGRLRRFVQQERESGLHPAIRALHQRAHGRDGDTNGRAVQYARIARGHMA